MSYDCDFVAEADDGGFESRLKARLIRIAALAAGDEPRRLDKIVALAQEALADRQDMVMEVVYGVGNHTSNTSSMWHEALRVAGAIGTGQWSLGALDKRTGAEIAPFLEAAVADMVARPEVYRAMNHENKWGTYETTLCYLESCLRGARRFPNAVFNVDK